jgi:hypothetical protein
VASAPLQTGKLSGIDQALRRRTGSQAVKAPRLPPGPGFITTSIPTYGVPAM